MTATPAAVGLLTIALTAPPSTFDLVATGLEQLAEQRRRAGVAAAGELEVDRQAGRDIRTGSTRVVRVLAEADTLGRVAAVLRDNLGQSPTPPAPAGGAPLDATVRSGYETGNGTGEADPEGALARLAAAEAAVAAVRRGALPPAPAVVPGATWLPDPEAVLAAVEAEELALAVLDALDRVEVLEP